MIAQVASRQVDPAELTPGQRSALELVQARRLFAGAGGYYGHAPHRITRATASRLISLGLVRLQHSGAGAELVLTGTGIATHAVMLERRRRR